MHPQMLTIHGPRGEQITELVQLTDQSFHALFLFFAALIIATV
ncbi:hypothetical protein OG883_41290 [Streptomyces sp. NBC_01142]|nr:hypothetical protein [Streptomyces sp. NBC_01142]MCX4826107.1 hypothetical protein [Streptomyces sp. NBC_01142]